MSVALTLGLTNKGTQKADDLQREIAELQEQRTQVQKMAGELSSGTQGDGTVSTSQSRQLDTNIANGLSNNQYSSYEDFKNSLFGGGSSGSSALGGNGITSNARNLLGSIMSGGGSTQDQIKQLSELETELTQQIETKQTQLKTAQAEKKNAQEAAQQEAQDAAPKY